MLILEKDVVIVKHTEMHGYVWINMVSLTSANYLHSFLFEFKFCHE